jgi:hypothetical protein
VASSIPTEHQKIPMNVLPSIIRNKNVTFSIKSIFLLGAFVVIVRMDHAAKYGTIYTPEFSQKEKRFKYRYLRRFLLFADAE